MSPEQLSWTARIGRFPRVSGDEPLTKELEGRGYKFSPRERG